MARALDAANLAKKTVIRETSASVSVSWWFSALAILYGWHYHGILTAARGKQTGAGGSAAQWRMLNDSLSTVLRRAGAAHLLASRQRSRRAQRTHR